MNDTLSPIELPDLEETTIDRIERAVFAEISPAAGAVPASRGRRRRRRWLTGAGIAAAFVAGILVTPPIMATVAGGPMATPMSGVQLVSDGAMPDVGFQLGGAIEESSAVARDALSGAVGETAAGREVIANANATVRVKDIASAADAIADLAEEHGGFVESTDIGRASVSSEVSQPVPPDAGYGWIGIRVPAADLTTVIDELAQTGEVVSSSVSKQDITSIAIDLRARVDATRTSVERLTELMSQTGSVSELIEAEVALTERQAQLESYEQQLAALEDQVAMSTLHVELTRVTTPTTADPAGFGDGLLAGWNGLVVSLNALVIAFGFLLPWLAVAAVVGAVVWAVLRLRRRARARAARATD